MSKNNIKNLDKGCQILRLLADNASGLSATEIGSKLTISRTTLFRILCTFQDSGFIEKRDRIYHCGAGLFQIGIKSLSSVRIRNISVTVLQRLAMDSGETAHLAVPSGLQTMILEVCDSPHPIRIAGRPGSLADLHCSSTGKLFLAYLFYDNLDDILNKLELTVRTERTLVTVESLKQEITKVREQGYGLDDEEYFTGVRCLAVPVHDSTKRIIAAVGITGTTGRFTKDKIPSQLQHLHAAAERLEKRIQSSCQF